MDNVKILKKVTLLLFLALIVNIILKLFGRILLSSIMHWLFICSGNDCHGMLWWQYVPRLEKIVWFLIDSLETTNQ
ncbi:uncharacterized protein ZBIST_4824 [Zygosaccharomyces bailii]|nr:uncharacterized protein ZBIST_4824 [Zygosaccharomyces bailii]